MGTQRAVLLFSGAAVAVFVAVVLALTNGGSGSAAVPRAMWQLYERAGNSTPFVSGTTPLDPPASDGAGYEIVSLAGQPLATGLATYRYGGPDLPVSVGGPMPALVECSADFTAASMNLRVVRVFPYAGCVFFVGARNISDSPITIEIGSLTGSASIACDAPGCDPDDLEVVAGGPDRSAADSLCRFEGNVGSVAGELTFELDPGATVVCPLFIVALQSSVENASYTVTVVPPLTGVPD